MARRGRASVDARGVLSERLPQDRDGHSRAPEWRTIFEKVKAGSPGLAKFGNFAHQLLDTLLPSVAPERMTIERPRAGAGGGCGRSSAISRKISWNSCRGMATSAIWKTTFPDRFYLIPASLGLVGIPVASQL